MSEDNPKNPTDFSEFTRERREKVARIQDSAEELLTATAEYVKANPWVAVAGAAVVGSAVAAIVRSHEEPKKLSDIRNLLKKEYRKLPTQKAVRSMTESLDLPNWLHQFSELLKRP